MSVYIRGKSEEGFVVCLELYILLFFWVGYLCVFLCMCLRECGQRCLSHQTGAEFGLNASAHLTAIFTSLAVP